MTDPNVTPQTPLRCDRCGGEWTVAQAEANPYTCPHDCWMGPRWMTLDGVRYHVKAALVPQEPKR